MIQENSYYPTGLILPNSPVGTTLTSNKQLYNGGSEWQNDYTNLPDYYQTANRNYDAAIARFVGVDPLAESAESMTSYQYAGNNPVMNNDPNGGVLQAEAPFKNTGVYQVWGGDNGDPDNDDAADDFESQDPSNSIGRSLVVFQDLIIPDLILDHISAVYMQPIRGLPILWQWS